MAKLAGTVTTSVNYATGLVTVTLNLTQGGVAYGTFTGQGAITAGNNQFTHPSTYVFVIMIIGCILTQMNYFNKALSQFSTNMYVAF